MSYNNSYGSWARDYRVPVPVPMPKKSAAERFDIRVGDTVEFKSVGKVVKVGALGFYNEVATLDTGANIDLTKLDNGELTHRLVKRARPKVGDKLTGAELSAHMWKRGTIIQGAGNGTQYVLAGDGKWLHLDSVIFQSGYSFAAFSSRDRTITLVFDAGQK